MRSFGGFAVVLAAWAAVPAAAQPALRVERGKVLFRNMELAAVGPFVSSPGAPTGLLWSRTVTHTTAVPSIRVHIQVRQGRAAGDWRIKVRDLAGTEVEFFTGGSPQVAAGAFWTGVVPGRGARIELWSDAGPQELEIAIDQYAFRTVAAIPQAISGLDQLIPIGSAPPAVQVLGKPIARLSFVTTEGQFVCTGFLLTASLLLTNQHCLGTPAEAQSALVEFGFDDFTSEPKAIRVTRLEATSVPLDYSVVRLAETPGPRTGRVSLSPTAATDGEALVIVQHPAGEPKQASIEDCKVSGVSRAGVGGGPTDFGHLCDTLGGSSGSPVMDRASGQVVGLHHWGFLPTNPEPVNQAVNIGLVVDDIKLRFPGVHAELFPAHP